MIFLMSAVVLFEIVLGLVSAITMSNIFVFTIPSHVSSLILVRAGRLSVVVVVVVVVIVVCMDARVVVITVLVVIIVDVTVVVAVFIVNIIVAVAP